MITYKFITTYAEPSGFVVSDNDFHLPSNLGNGTEANPYLIYDAESFNNIRHNLSAHYKLIADIDFEGAQLTPIGGKSFSMQFKGSLDGDGHALKNFTITSSTNRVGLFAHANSAKFTDLIIENAYINCTSNSSYTALLVAYAVNCNIKNIVIKESTVISSGSTVGTVAGQSSNCRFENIKIIDCNVEAKDYVGALTGFSLSKSHFENIEVIDCNIKARDFAGIMAGYLMTGSISNSSITGDSKVAGNDYIGGLIGMAAGVRINDSSVKTTGKVSGNRFVGGLTGCVYQSELIRCFAKVEVIGSSIYIGGLVGLVGAGSVGARFDECYAQAEVTGLSNVGGLAGAADDISISNCFALGYVNSSSNSAFTGGLIGNAFTNTKVINCYAAANVSENGRGLISFNPNTSMLIVDNSYYDSIIMPDSPIDDKNVGKTTTMLFRKSSYQDWDFTRIWDIDEARLYPYLRNIEKPDSVNFILSMLDGRGSIEDPYLISRASHFDFINLDLTAHYKVIADIDFGGAIRNPIGTDEFAFSGRLDGNGHTIKNFTITGTGSHVGFFANAKSAKFRNLTIENAHVNQTSENMYTGLLLGYGESVVFENINIIESTAASNGDYTGMLSGFLHKGTVSDYKVIDSSVNGADYVGGLAGSSSAVITDSFVKGTGKISGDSYIGGLIGDMPSGSVVRSYTVVEVMGSADSIGGLIGQTSNASPVPIRIDESYTGGDVSGRENVGGLVGQTSNTTISNCFTTGSVISTNNNVSTGGLVGNAHTGTTISNSYAAGNVSTNGSGLVYVITASIIEVKSSYFDSTKSSASISDTHNIGKLTPMLLKSSTYANWDFENIWYLADNSYPKLRSIDKVNSFELDYSGLSFTQILITWPEIEGVESYDIFYANETKNTTETEILIENLSSDKDYEFTVRANYPNTSKAVSKPLLIKTEAYPNIIKGFHSIKKGSDYITLAWEHVADYDFYEVTVDNDVFITNQNIYTITGLTTDTPYTFTVRAVITNETEIIRQTSQPIIEKIFDLNPQTEYAQLFIDKCEGQTWFIDKIENLLNMQDKSINTISSRQDLESIYAIGLTNRGLSGRIPKAIGELFNLKYLYLSGNHFWGGLPKEISLLENLLEIDF